MRPIVLLALLLAAPILPSAALAQTSMEGDLRLRIQALEEQVRTLTGENERLRYELDQARAGVVDDTPMDFAGDAEFGDAPTEGQPIEGAQGIPSAPAGPTLQPATPQIDLSTAPAGEAAGEAVAGTPGEGAPLDLLGGIEGLLSAPDPAASEPGATPPAPAGQAALAPAPSEPQPVAPPAAATEREAYDLAYGSIMRGDYPSAVSGFTAYLERYPDSPRVADARFWLAEAQLETGKFEEAARAFLDSYEASPQGERAPRTLLNLGRSLAGMGETTSACSTYDEVKDRYPDAGLEDRIARAREDAGC